MDQPNLAGAAATEAQTFNMTDFMARLAERQAERDAENRVLRAELVAMLRDAGVETVTAHYDAYGDSGNIEEVVLLPEIPKVEPVAVEAEADRPQEDADHRLTTADASKLDDFLWSTVYGLHPGFENNEGGYGDISWDVCADGISIEHSDRFVDVNCYSHEGV